MDTLLLKSHRTVVLCGLLFALCGSASPLRSEELQAAAETQGNGEYPATNSSGDKLITATNSSRLKWIETEKLQPWIERYQSLGADFGHRNALAFRFAKRNYGWWDRMSLMAWDPQTTEESLAAIAHLASAYYTNLSQQQDVVRCLRNSEPRIVMGQLRILRVARELRPVGTDLTWPTSGPLDPVRLPKYIVIVLEQHPELSLEVARSLEVYGTSAMKEAGDLIPLLVAEDAAVAAAAQSAIRKMDPQGITKLFRLEGQPLTPSQREWIHGYLKKLIAFPVRLPIVDCRESDGSPQSEMSQRYEELRRYLRFYGVPDDRTYAGQMAAALHFRDQNRPGDWWRVLSSVYPHAEAEFGIYRANDHLLRFATALYTKPGSQAELIRLLQDEDYRIAEGALGLVITMRQYKPGLKNYSDGDLIDTDVMPAHIIRILDRHPHIGHIVASCLSVYGTHASAQVEALVPLLLSDDTTVVKRVRTAITAIDPGLAQQLEITRVQLADGSDFNLEEYLSDDASVDGPSPLTPRQRELVQAHLKSHGRE